MLLIRVIEALRKARVPHAVAGGHAVALHGAVRGTLDIDLLLKFDEQAFVRAERALRSIGLEPRLPVEAREVFRFRQEWLTRRNLTAWTFVNPQRPSEIVDVVLTHDLAETGTSRVRVDGRQLRIVALDDLIAMKRDSGRAQDLEDVAALEKIRRARSSTRTGR